MILITGANGLIGRALVRRLAKERLPMRLALRNASSMKQAVPELDQIDLAPHLVQHDFEEQNAEAMLKLCENVSTIVHCAGLAHQPNAAPELYDILNYRTTVMLATAAKQQGVGKFIFLSSSAVYGPTFENALESSVLKQPHTEYARSKYECEAYLAGERPVPTTVSLRPGLVFGEGDRGNMLSLIRQVLKRRYFHIGAGSAKKSIVYSADVAEIINACLQLCPQGHHVLNVANHTPSTLREIADAIAVAGGLTSPVPTLPESLVRAGSIALSIFGKLSPLSPDRLAKLTTSTTLSVEALESATGVKTTRPVSESLANEIAWARATGLL